MHRTENIKEFAVIGYPLDQSMSPVLLNEVFNQLNISTFNQLNLDPIRNKILLQILPLKV